ncbi:MAG: radical SAM protein [Egibacteraceae bacterium]
MTLRMFRVEPANSGAVVHDPCTGLTHWAQIKGLDPGRVWLDDTVVGGWAVARPQELDRAMPVSVCWSPIVRCNLSCPHCLDDKSVHEADQAQRRQVADRIAAAGVLGVDISGGEPLLLADLGDLAGRLIRGGCVVSVTSNGWRLARRAAELSGRVDAVRVSLDGPDAGRHDRWRGHGSFDRAVAGLRACAARGVPAQIQTVLMSSNGQDAQDMVDLAATEGVYGITFLQLLPIGKAVRLPGDQLLGDAEAARVVAGLDVPEGLRVRLRQRQAADGFTVVRADGTVWGNTGGAHAISRRRLLRDRADLALEGADGSA